MGEIVENVEIIEKNEQFLLTFEDFAETVGDKLLEKMRLQQIDEKNESDMALYSLYLKFKNS